MEVILFVIGIIVLIGLIAKFGKNSIPEIDRPRITDFGLIRTQFIDIPDPEDDPNF